MFYALTKYPASFFLLLALVISYGCLPNNAKSTNSLSITPPAQLNSRALSDDCANSLSADVLIDNQVVGKLQRQMDRWQGQVNISRGTHTLKIEFKCTSDAHGTLSLAINTQERNFSANDNLSLASNDYQYPDNDSDGSSNLAELQAGTDPSDSQVGGGLNSFKWANPLPQGNSLTDIIWNGNEFLSVGQHGTIMTSGNGASWSVTRSANTENLQGAAWSGNQYIIVGVQGTLLTRPANSPDWTIRDTGTNKDLFGITWTGSQFVAVGDDIVITSADGVSWVTHALPKGSLFRSVTWTGKQLVAVGAASNESTHKLEGAIITSTDGAHWSSPKLTGTASLWDIEWTGSQLVAVGGDQNLSGSTAQSQGGIILTSADGESWQRQTSGADDVDLHAVTYEAGTGTIIIAGGSTRFIDATTPNHSVILSSADGINWTIRDSSPYVNHRGIASSPSQTVVIGDAGIIKSSTNANLQQWDNHTSGSVNTLNDMVSMGNKLVAVGANGEVLTSKDGRSWASRDSGTSTELTAVTSTGPTLLVAVGGRLSPAQNGLGQIGSDGIILTSPDGINWTNQTPEGSLGLIRDVTWTGSQFIAVGSSGLILTSPDGIQWTPQNSGTDRWLNTVSSSNDLIVIAGGDHSNQEGNGGTILSSSDGINWTSTSGLDENLDLMSVTWTGATFTAVGGIFHKDSDNESRVLTSSDGTDWATVNPGINSIIRDVHWTGSRLLAVSNENSILLTSTDGHSWTLSPTLSSNGQNSIIEYQRSTLIAGGNGTILYREN
jgi:hypothetical protein